MAHEKLTGRVRLAPRGLFKQVLVVEVEVEYGDGPSDFHGLPSWLAGKRWRPARVEDGLTLKIKEHN